MAKPTPKKKDPEAEVLAKIAEMTPADRAIAEPLHALIREAGPDLTPRLWYSQPAYARAGKVVLFFRGADFDGERYFTVGVSGHAAVDDGHMWPTAYALTQLSPDTEQRIRALVEQVASA